MALINEAKRFSANRMGPDRLAGYPHAERVMKNALALQKVHGGDRDLIEVAAILHDVAFDGKNLATHATESANAADTFLRDQGMDFAKRQAMKRIIGRHTMRDWTMNGAPQTLEEKILFDAETVERLSMHGLLKFVFTAQKIPYASTEQVIRSIEKFIDENYRAVFFEETRQKVEKGYLLFKTVLEEAKEGAGL